VEAMSTEVQIAIISLIGIIIGAFPTYLFMRKRNSAELDKLRAETDKLKAEAEKIRGELTGKVTSDCETVNSVLLPKEYCVSFSARREALPQSQGMILKYFSRNSIVGQFISQDTLEDNFSQFKQSELFYRLETLRLLGFLDNQKSGQDTNGADRFSYRLSESYRKQIGNTDIFVKISTST
jgi:hypothetical protein